MDTKHNNMASQEKYAYETIRTAIIDGRIMPGYRLVERDLALKLGISRTPIRAAINTLLSQDLVTKVPNKGVTVTSLDKSKLVELLYIRESLEGMIARLAAKNRSEEQAKALNSLINEIKGQITKSDSHEYYKLIGELYRVIFAASNNKQLTDLATHINNQVARYQFMILSLQGRTKASYKENKAIVGAITKREEEGAQRIMQLHIAKVRELIESKLKEDENLLDKEW